MTTLLTKGYGRGYQSYGHGYRHGYGDGIGHGYGDGEGEGCGDGDGDGWDDGYYPLTTDDPLVALQHVSP